MFGELDLEYRIGRRYTVHARALLNTVDSTDPRGEYDRNQLSIGVTWRP